MKMWNFILVNIYIDNVLKGKSDVWKKGVTMVAGILAFGDDLVIMGKI